MEEEILSKNVASTLEAIREESDQLTSSQKESEKIYEQNSGARDDEDEGNLNSGFKHIDSDGEDDDDQKTLNSNFTLSIESIGKVIKKYQRI